MRKLIPPALALAAALYAGCNQSNSPTPPVAEATAKADADPKKAEEHPHKPGQHGGIIVEIGRDNYHAEAVFEKGGVVRVYLLGKDEARVQEVEKQTLTAYVKREQDTESSAIALKPTPQEGDAEGKTSLFVGQLPADLQGKRVVVTVPSIRQPAARRRPAREGHQRRGTPALPDARRQVHAGGHQGEWQPDGVAEVQKLPRGPRRRPESRRPDLPDHGHQGQPALHLDRRRQDVLVLLPAVRR